MSQEELRVELEKRYCPVCRFDTQHAVRSHVKLGYPRPDELVSACGVCNADGFWGLRLAAEAAVRTVAAVPSA